MFGLFDKNMSVERAKRKLRKLDIERSKLIKIINGHVILESDIEHGIVVVNDQNIPYKIRSEGFGLYNVYTQSENLFLNGAYSQQRVLNKSLSKYDLANTLNDNGFRIVNG